MGRLRVAALLVLVALSLSAYKSADTAKDTQILVRLCAPQNAYIEDFETNDYKLWLEEQTGLTIEMSWLPAGDAEQMMKLALSTGENLPDAYVGFGSKDELSYTILRQYGKQGRILPLNDLIDRHGENLKSVWQEGGVQLATVSIPLPKVNGIITTACKNPEAVFELFDLMLSEEACLIGRYGEQGVDWDFASEGDVSIYGTEATVRIINQLWNMPQNKHLRQIVPYVSRPKFSGGVTWDGTTVDGEYMNAQAAMAYESYDPAEFVGMSVYTSAEELAIGESRTAISQYVRQSMADFITGAQDIDSDKAWTAYKDQFALGPAAFLDVSQQAQNRIVETQ